MALLAESLELKEREVISLVGAGGKTTLMFYLAEELRRAGKRVISTTTTKILEPTSADTPLLFIDSEDARIRRFVEEHLDQYGQITVASERLGSGKLRGISTDLVLDLWDHCLPDYIVIEADGAAERPVKAPREKEPVIPSNTTLVVAILGAEGIGAELSEKQVFQPARVSELTGVPLGERMTVESMATLFTHSQGLFKGAPPSSRLVAFLNKLDLLKDPGKAREVAEKVIETRHPRIERVILGQLRHNPPVVEVLKRNTLGN